MKKRILVLFLVVLALTSVVQLAMISHPKMAEAAMAPSKCCVDCYDECDRWCVDPMGFEYCCHSHQQCFTICPCGGIDNHVASQ